MAESCHRKKQQKTGVLSTAHMSHLLLQEEFESGALLTNVFPRQEKREERKGPVVESFDVDDADVDKEVEWSMSSTQCTDTLNTIVIWMLLLIFLIFSPWAC